MEELKRRLAASKSWGIASELIDPARVKELVPYIETSIILGGFYTPGVGVVDSLRAGTIMRERATEMGALTIASGTEVTGIDVVDGHVRGVHTDRGTIAADTVLICCGVWSPRIARMAGASIPLTPAIHQMISVGPVPLFADTVGEITYPIVRDMDTNMYERQHGGDLEVGSYAHRPILMDPDDIPSIAQSKLSPTELPFTQEDFEPQLEHALELVPDILGDERVGIRHSINGLLSLTPDGMPILGETPEVKGLWSAAAIWIKEAPGIARTVAEWMTHGTPEIDPHSSDIARFYDHHRTAAHIDARSAEGFNKTYGIVHPMEQWASNRDVRLSPINARQRGLGAVFFEAAGWERPFWYGANEKLLDEYGERVMPRAAEWESRWWSPIINAEHLAMRDRVGMVDLAAFAIFDVSGPGALAYLQGLVVNQVDVPVGRVVYTPLLNEAGGIVADLTIMRLGHDLFRVVTGGGMGMRDKKWFVDHSSTTRRPGGTRSGSGDRALGTSWPRRPRMTCRTRASRSAPAGPSTSAASGPSPRGSRTSASSAGRSTPPWSRACGCGTRSGTPAPRMAWSLSGSASTPRPAASRRATAPTATSSSWTSTSSRPGWRARRSRRPTSSARPPTSSSAPSRPPRSCAR
jgi:glycine/D-amino acid oxidase-like deaminating enzyme